MSPIGERRLLGAWLKIEMGRQIISGNQHFARCFGVKSFVGIPNGRFPEVDAVRKGNQDQDYGMKKGGVKFESMRGHG